jgi:hypothetical protein
MIHPAMIRRLIPLSPLAVVLLLVLGSSVASNRQPRFLLRAVDGVTSTLPTAGPDDFTNCVLVMPDGRFYILLRRQEIMDGTGTAKGFEGSLNANSLRILRDLLDQESIRSAPKFDLPNTPFLSDEFQIFEARIDREAVVQRVGYFKWKGKGPDNPDLTKKQWQESELALQPLVEWLRALKTYKDPVKRPTSSSHALRCNLGNDTPKE